jgi:hypothetical protein
MRRNNARKIYLRTCLNREEVEKTFYLNYIDSFWESANTKIFCKLYSYDSIHAHIHESDHSSSVSNTQTCKNLFFCVAYWVH